MAEAARDFSTAVGVLRAAADGVPGALTEITKQRDLLDKEGALASEAEEEEKAKEYAEVIAAAREDAKGACDFAIEVIGGFLTGGPEKAAEVVGEKVVKGVNGAVADAG